MKKLKYFIFLILFSLFSFNVDKVKAASIQNFAIKYNGYNFDNSTFYFSTNGENTWFSIENETTYTMSELFEFGDYGKLAICSTGEVTNVYPRNDNVKNISFYNTGASCNLNNTPGYKGKIIYITFEVNWTTTNASEFCGSSTQYCLYDLEIANYWQTGGYLQLISFSFSKDPFIYDDTNDTIINQNTEINDSINNVNDSINNSNVDDPSSAINSFKNNLATNGVITQLVTLPVTLFTNVLNSVNGTCASYNLGSLFGTDLILPCISISNYIGNTLWSVIDVLISGFFVYAMSRKFIKVFENLSSMKEGDVISD